MDMELTKDLFNGLRNRNRNRTLQNDSFLNKMKSFHRET